MTAGPNTPTTQPLRDDTRQGLLPEAPTQPQESIETILDQTEQAEQPQLQIEPNDNEITSSDQIAASALPVRDNTSPQNDAVNTHSVLHSEEKTREPGTNHGATNGHSALHTEEKTPTTEANQVRSSPCTRCKTDSGKKPFSCTHCGPSVIKKNTKVTHTGTKNATTPLTSNSKITPPELKQHKEEAKKKPKLFTDAVKSPKIVGHSVQSRNSRTSRSGTLSQN